MTGVSSHEPDADRVRLVRRTVLVVAALNFAYFFIEVGVALAVGSVSLFADSVDFLEDTAVNLLVFVALGWSLRRRSVMGKSMALIILVPALAAAWEAVQRFWHPAVPDPRSMMLTAVGAIVVNGGCALLLMRIRAHGGSLGRAAFLAARNDVAINAAIIAMAWLTWWTRSGWPDLVLGVGIVVLNAGAAKEVWEVAEAERVAAQALAGEEIEA